VNKGHGSVPGDRDGEPGICSLAPIVPGLVTISALVMTVLFARTAPTAVTIGIVVVGTGLSALWFLAVIRKSGLRVRFAAA
jgi:hypothetical protein